MNKPSSTISAAGIAGVISGMMFMMIAVFAPAVYGRFALYPGAEAQVANAITLVVMLVAGYMKKENVLPLNKA